MRALALVLAAACGSPGKPASPPVADTGTPASPPDAAPVVPVAEPADYQVVKVDDGGTVLGLVTAAKLPPAAATAPVHGPAECPGSVAIAPLTMAATGGVVGALVWLDVARGKAAEPASGELSLRGCTFVPRAVLLGQAGELRVRNEDAVRHEVSVSREGTPLAAFPLPLEGSSAPVVLDRPGVYSLAAAGAPAPHALAVVAPHPYYTLTDSDGRYRLAGVPAGTYTVHAWHPGLGGQPPLSASAKIEIKADASVEAPMALAP